MRISDWSSDVCSSDLVMDAADIVEKRFGAVHLVANNAGIAQVGTPLDQVDDETYRWMFEVNVHGVSNGMAAFAPKLKANGAGGGHIVNTSSMAALFMVPGWHIGLYAATKKIGRAHVCTPVTNAHLVCLLLLETKKQRNI